MNTSKAQLLYNRMVEGRAIRLPQYDMDVVIRPMSLDPYLENMSVPQELTHALLTLRDGATPEEEEAKVFEMLANDPDTLKETLAKQEAMQHAIMVDCFVSPKLVSDKEDEDLANDVMWVGRFNQHDFTFISNLQGLPLDKWKRFHPDRFREPVSDMGDS